MRLPQEEIALWAGALAAAGYVLHKLRRHVLTPLWATTKNIVAWAEALPVLMGIAEEFKANAGTTLKDRITVIERGQEDHAGAIGHLTNLVEAHIEYRLPGGRRATDPQDGDHD